MHKELISLADCFRREYHCVQTAGVVENMLAKVAGRDVESAEDFTEAQLRKLSTFLRNPPFKVKTDFPFALKAVYAVAFVGAIALGLSRN